MGCGVGHGHELELLTKHCVARGGEATHPVGFLGFFFLDLSDLS